MQKLANSATAALHERDEFQKRLKINANKQKRAKVVAQAKNLRHKIPAEGLQFANHAELQAHFSGRQLADLASTNEKIKRMQGKVGKVEEKITELVSKLNKHSERLVAGKLPAKWHMPSRIEVDIGKERTKMDEFQAELRELELQASHILYLIDHRYGGEDEMGDEDDEMGNEEDETQMGGEDDEMGGVEDSDSDILNVGNLPLGVE